MVVEAVLKMLFVARKVSKPFITGGARATCTA